jgi:hypothetical protein
MSLTLDKPQTVHIHVGANIPGYLPESDVSCFDSVEGALEALRHELKDQQDDYFERCEATTPEQQEKGSDCCEWCSAALDVEGVLSAIADSGPDAHFVSEGRAGWIFSPPEGADVHHWALSITTDRDSCEIFADQGV